MHQELVAKEEAAAKKAIEDREIKLTKEASKKDEVEEKVMVMLNKNLKEDTTITNLLHDLNGDQLKDLLRWKGQAPKGKKAEVFNDVTNLKLEVIDLRKLLKDFNDEKNEVGGGGGDGCDEVDGGGNEGDEVGGGGNEGDEDEGGGNEGDEEQNTDEDSDNEHEDDSNRDDGIESETIPVVAQLMPIVAQVNQRGRKRKVVQPAEMEPHLDVRRKVSRGGA